MFLTVYHDRAQARYSAKELIGNGLEQLGYISESALITRKFKNFLKSCGIFRPCYRDKAVLQYGKLQYRFDPTRSNSKFKYEFFRQGGTLAELRTFPKRPFRPVVAYRDQTRGGLLTRAHKRLPGAVVWKPKRRSPKARRAAKRAKQEGNGSCQSSPNPGEPTVVVGKPIQRQLSKRKLSRLIRAARSQDNGTFVSILGGQVLNVPPAATDKHKKYWYFFRKRGEFAISLHHPVGDEVEIYRVPGIPAPSKTE
jgi:hypothetical protein